MRLRKISFILLMVIALAVGRSEHGFGEGIDVNFQNSSVPTINNMLSSSPETASSQVATFLHALRSALEAASSNASGSDTSANNLASPSQRYNAIMGLSSLELFDTDEQIAKELMPPVIFSPLPENESLWSCAQPYSVTICLSFDHPPMPDCSGTTTPEEAARKLAENLLSAQFKKTDPRPFRVIMPAAMPMDQQKKLLYQIESQAIALIEAQAFPDEARLQAYDIIARQAAQNGVNWAQTRKETISVHRYHIRQGFINLTAHVNE